MEEKKRSNDIKVFFLVFVLVILAAVLAYFYLYMPMTEDRNELLKENHTLETKLITLKNKSQKETEFINGITASNSEMEAVLNKYSAGNTPEKSIMMAARMEEEVKIHFPNLSFTEPSVVSSVQMPVVMKNEAGEYVTAYYDVNLLKETLTTSYVCTYEQLKEMIKFINGYPERMNIDAITVSYDSVTKGLTGSLTLNLFAVTGTDKAYLAPEINALRFGKENIFGE